MHLRHEVGCSSKSCHPERRAARLCWRRKSGVRWGVWGGALSKDLQLHLPVGLSSGKTVSSFADSTPDTPCTPRAIFTAPLPQPARRFAQDDSRIMGGGLRPRCAIVLHCALKSASHALENHQKPPVRERD